MARKAVAFQLQAPPLNTQASRVGAPVSTHQPHVVRAKSCAGPRRYVVTRGLRPGRVGCYATSRNFRRFLRLYYDEDAQCTSTAQVSTHPLPGRPASSYRAPADHGMSFIRRGACCSTVVQFRPMTSIRKPSTDPQHCADVVRRSVRWPRCVPAGHSPDPGLRKFFAVSYVCNTHEQAPRMSNARLAPCGR